MSDPPTAPLHVPTVDELRRCVVPRPKPGTEERKPTGAPPTREVPPVPSESPRMILSAKADAFLRHAAQPRHKNLHLESRWQDLGITSGSTKKSVLKELHRHGFIRLERKGRTQMVHLFNRAWEYLGIASPTGEGVGGTTHRALVKSVASTFKKRGYEVHIEQEVGKQRKRVDLVCYRHKRIIGVEVGISDPRQEIKNLRADLETGVLDTMFFISSDAGLLRRVQHAAGKDPFLAVNADRIKFFYFNEEFSP